MAMLSLSDRSLSIRGIAQSVNAASLVDNQARRGDRQPVAPFLGEHSSDSEELLGQFHTA
jgi:hypothetical protein